MDLNDALHTCRCGGCIRDDANMAADWKIEFVADKSPENNKRPPHQRLGFFRYINPKGEPAHAVKFSDAHKASYQWRTVI
jgi:hypothetical protein